MTKLYYKSITIPTLSASPLMLISSIENEDDGEMLLNVFGADFSYVIINERKYRLIEGKTQISREKLPQGLCEVTFVSGTKKIHASPFFVHGEKIERPPLDGDIACRLEKVLVKLAERLALAEEKILALEEKTEPKNMFNFI